MSIFLHNQLCKPSDSPSLSSSSYGWQDWYPHVKSAAKGINNANNQVLIFFSGRSYDTDVSPIPTANNLGNNEHFHRSISRPRNKLVLELHNYAAGASSCSGLENRLYTAGFDALIRAMRMWLTFCRS